MVGETNVGARDVQNKFLIYNKILHYDMMDIMINILHYNMMDIMIYILYYNMMGIMNIHIY